MHSNEKKENMQIYIFSYFCAHFISQHKLQCTKYDTPPPQKKNKKQKVQ